MRGEELRIERQAIYVAYGALHAREIEVGGEFWVSLPHRRNIKLKNMALYLRVYAGRIPPVKHVHLKSAPNLDLVASLNS